jgi:hypothetical protein
MNTWSTLLRSQGLEGAPPHVKEELDLLRDLQHEEPSREAASGQTANQLRAFYVIYLRNKTAQSPYPTVHILHHYRLCGSWCGYA